MITIRTIENLRTNEGEDAMLVELRGLSTDDKPKEISSKKIDSMFRYVTKLTNFGGLKDLGKNYLTTANENYGYYKLDLSSCTSLTHNSLMNVINNLYDIATAGVKTQQLVLGSTNLAKLTTEEIAIATNKGWAVS